MGKKKKSFYKQMKPLIKNNKVFLAAIGGVATGITLAKVLGTEKANEILGTIEDSVKKFSARLSNDGQESNEQAHSQTPVGG